MPDEIKEQATKNTAVEKPSESITALQFADIKAFTDLDKRVVKKIYGVAKKSIAEWHKILKDNFNYKSE